MPGITAGVAAPAYAGIPVTQRGVASAVAFVTGHEDPAKPETAIDWPALARLPRARSSSTWACGSCRRIAEQLIAGGRAADEPAAVVERGTLPGQRTVRAPLRGIAEAARAAEVRAPAITLVGPVAALADELAWLERPPAARPHRRRHARAGAGQRARGAAARPRRRRRRGARDPRRAARRPTSPTSPPTTSSCITSPNGAQRAHGRACATRGRSPGPTIAVIGPGTARALREHGIEADIVPSRSVAEGLVAALAEIPARRALIARAEEARDVLPDALRARGVEVDVLALYRTIAEPLGDEARAAALGRRLRHVHLGLVRALLPRGRGHARRARGSSRSARSTSAAMRELGFEPDVEAADHTPDGLVAALLADASGTVAG